MALLRLCDARARRVFCAISLCVTLGCTSEPLLSDAADRGASEDDDESPGSSSDGEDETNEVAAGPKRTDGGTTAPTSESDEDACASIREDAPARRAAADVIWLVDTSGSMRDELAQVQANIANFMREFEQSDTDTRALMITGLDPAAGTALAADAQRYRFVPTKVDSGDLFNTALRTFEQYRDFLRPDAITHFVMVTDDEDKIAAQEFRAQMEQRLGHGFIQHAVASESVGGRPCRNVSCAGLLCGGAADVGEAYYALADSTMGEKISICSSDWGEVFGRLREAVVASAPLPCTYALPDVQDATVDPKKVAVVYTPEGARDRELPKASGQAQCADQTAWHYDDERAPESVVLCPAACELVRAGGSIDIAIGCAPQVII